MVSDKAVRQGLYQKLNVSAVTTQLGSGSASLFHGEAPADATYPLIIFYKQSGTPRLALGGQAFKSALWLVKAIDRSGSSSKAEDIDKAVNDALDFKVLSVTGARNLFLARESDVDYSEIDEGQQYRHHGALYRAIVE